MISPTLPKRPALLHVAAGLLGWRRSGRSAPATATESTDEAANETRQRRDFILDMLDWHPDAFHSEHDVVCMMTLYKERF